MELKSRLSEDLKDALRTNDEVRKTSIRSIMAAVKLTEVEKGSPLDDAGVVSVVQKEIKQRKESIQDAEKAGRQELINGFLKEISELEKYLPKQLTAEELEQLVRSAIEQTGAVSPTDMGKVMKIVMPLVQGRAANDQVSSAVRSLLSK
jgi:hypothetical protein